MSYLLKIEISVLQNGVHVYIVSGDKNS